MNEMIETRFLNNLETILANQNAAVLGKVGELSMAVQNVEKKFNDHDERINRLENDEEITTKQKKQIRSAVARRVYTILELPSKRSEWDRNNYINEAKYGKLFFKRCYSEVAKLGHLTSPYESTPKKYYDDAMKDIEAWFPIDGIEGLKLIADKKAEARIQEVRNEKVLVQKSR